MWSWVVLYRYRRNLPQNYRQSTRFKASEPRKSIEERHHGFIRDFIVYTVWVFITHSYQYRLANRYALPSAYFVVFAHIFYMKEANKKEARNKHNKDHSFRLLLGILYIRIHCHGGYHTCTFIDWRPNVIILLLTSFIFRRWTMETAKSLKANADYARATVTTMTTATTVIFSTQNNNLF